jgi:Tol biopolymer transport system component
MVCPAAWAQDQNNENQYAIFVSQRGGTAELYLLNLQTRAVSQLTNTGRGHLAPVLARKTNSVVFAAREGGQYEIFTAGISYAWRTRRPQLTMPNRLTINTFDEVSPSFSADGALVVFASGDGIEFMTASGGARQLLVAATEAARDYCPVLSPDGNQVAFISTRTNAEEIILFDRTTNTLRQLTSGAHPVGGLSWSADGQKLAFTTAHTDSKLTGVAIVEIATGAYRVVSEHGDSSPTFSPRGDKLLMTSTRDGDPEIYLFDLNNSQATRLTFSAGPDDGAIFIPSPGSVPRRLP